MFKIKYLLLTLCLLIAISSSWSVQKKSDKVLIIVNSVGELENQTLSDLIAAHDFVDLSKDRLTSDTFTKEAAAHFMYSNYLIEEEKYDQAIAEIEQAKKIMPDSIDIARSLAKAYYYNKSYEQSLKLCDEVLKKDPKDGLTYFLKGQIYEDQSDIKLASENFEKAISLLPDYVKLYEYTASFYVKSGEIDKGINTFEKLVKKDENNIYAVMMLSFSYKQLGKSAKLSKGLKEADKNFEKSIFYFKEVQRLQPEYLPAYVNLGEIYDLQDKYDEAFKTYKQAFIIDPKDTDVRKKLEELIQKNGKEDKVIEEYKKIAAEYPNDINIQSTYAEKLIADKKYTDAIKVYEKMIELDPENITTYRMLSSLYFLDSKTLSNAITTLNKAIKKSPENISLYSMLAECYLKNKDYDNALRVYDNALQIDDTDVDIYLAKAITLKTAGKIEEAKQLIRDSMRKNGVDEKLLNVLISYSSGKPDDDGAIKELKSLLEQYPDNQTLLYFTAEIYIIRKEYKEAINYYEKLLEMDPTNSQYYISLSYLYNETNNSKKSEEILESAMNKIASDGNLLLYAAQFYLEKDDLKKSEELIKQYQQTDAENYDGYIILATIYDKKNDLANTENTLRKAIAIDPSRAEAYNHLGYVYVEKDMKLDEAEDLIKKAISIKPDEGYIIDSMGWLYYKKKDYKKAKEYLLKALETMADDPTINDHVGDIYHALKDNTNAVKYWKQSYDLKNSPEVKEKIKKFSK